MIIFQLEKHHNPKTNIYALYLRILKNTKAQVNTVLDVLSLEKDGKNDKPL